MKEITMLTRNLSLALLFSLSIALVGCGSQQKKTNAAGSDSVVSDSGNNQGLGLEVNGDSDSNKAGGLKTVYFDFNSSSLRDDTRATLESNAAFLKSNPNVKVHYSSDTHDSDLDDNYLFDFAKNFAGGSNFNTNRAVSFTSNAINTVMSTEDDSDVVVTTTTTGSNGDKSEVPAKVKVKPIDVLNELETTPLPSHFLTNLDNKISVLRDKADIIRQKYAKREVSALVERLENRKKWQKFAPFFNQFQNTNDEKIQALLSKYDLVMKESEIFIPEFPDEAIKVMKDYTKVCKQICEKKPVFYVIAPPDMFKSVVGKRDPILLVQSPFGFYWQILGAWDKEMLLLSEL